MRLDGVSWDADHKSFMARCPVHDDRKASLSVSVGDRGGIVFNCFAGCKTEDVLREIGLTFKDVTPGKEESAPRQFNFDYNGIVARYVYQNGTRKLRDGNKQFVWEHLDESGQWRSKRGNAPHVLYMPKQGGDKVYIVEGEKDAENVAKMGLCAASSEHGANMEKLKWYDTYTAALIGKDVVCIPDNDDVGRKHMADIAATIHGKAKSVKVLDLRTAFPNLPAKNDISDIIENMGRDKTLSLLAEMEEQTAAWEPEKKDIFDEFGFYTIPELTEEERKPPDFLIDGLLPVGMTFLSGAPKTRKSFLAFQIAVAVATGAPFFKRKTMQCDVVYFDLEGSKSRISYRTERISEDIPKNIYIANEVKEKLAGELVPQIRMLHQQHPRIRLVIIDTYSRARGLFKGGGANAYDQDVAFLEPIQRMALQENIAILFVHHDKKGAGFMADSFERLSGTMGISGSADCVMNLITEGKRFDGKATLEFTPRDAKGGEINLAFNDYFMEWEMYDEQKTDLLSNPVCAWIMQNTPEPKKDARFFPYDIVFTQAYKTYSERPGDEVKRQVEANQDALFLEQRIAVQTGVSNNGKRGIRTMRV